MLSVKAYCSHVISYFKPLILKRKWRKNNRHNGTRIGTVRDYHSITVGRESYGVINVEDTRPGRKLIIGHFCSIGKNVSFVLCADHPINMLSTFPFQTCIFGNNIDAISKGNIVIEDEWGWRKEDLDKVKIFRYSADK